MDKKRIKKYISWVCIAALVLVLAVLPMIAGDDDASDGPQASVLSAEAVLGDIDRQIIGGGTLAAEEAVELTVPASVKLTGYLVANGDTVSAGQPIAAVDRVSVMSAVTEVQETLELIAEELEDASGDTMSDEIVTQAGGTVKILYAREGDSVTDVMLEHGALAVLSLDGLMEVTVERSTDLTAGDSVLVTLANGTEVTGRVESNYDGVLTVTISDDGYAVGETVKVVSDDGDRIGSGQLAIHSPWNAVGYSGTVKSVHISEGQTVTAGKTLITLEDTGSTAEYQQLSAQHREYEALMLELFQMYQTETITAPCDGIVTGLDENSANLLSDSGKGWFLDLLTNAPNGDDETAYVNYIGQVAQVGIDGLILNMNPRQFSVTDYKDLSGVSTDPGAMTEEVIYSAQAPIYELVDGEWTQIQQGDIGAGDILLFAGDDAGNIVWVVRVSAAKSGEVVQPDPTEPSVPEVETDPTVPREDDDPSGDQTEAGTTPGQSNQDASMPGSGSNGNFGGTSQEETLELYSLDTVVIASVTPQDAMTLEITVDELDIGSLTVGQAAEITLDALSGRFFTATVTKLGNTGTSDGGNSKFTVELTLQRQEDMLPGMNATAYITLDTASQVLTVPVAALQDTDGATVLYTSYDEESGSYGGAVTVSVGVSDGEIAQILSGIEAGTTVYYPYYDTLVVSDGVSSGGFDISSIMGSGRGNRR